MKDQDVLTAMKTEGQVREKALYYLYRQHLPMAVSFVTRNRGSKLDAEDKFQDAILDFFEDVRDGEFQGKSTIKTYLYALIRFKWLNELKRRGLGDQYLALEMELAQEFPKTPAEIFTSEEQKNTLDQILEKLGESCRRLLRFRFWEYKPFKEIGVLMGFQGGEQSAKNKQQKCLETLRRLISDDPSANDILGDMI